MMGYAAANEFAGTISLYRPLEAIKVKLVRKGSGRPSPDSSINVSELEAQSTNLVYQGNTSSTVGHQGEVAGQTPTPYMELGFTGRSTALKGFKLSLSVQNSSTEYIQYRGHFAKTGWTGWTNGNTSVTSSNNDLQAVSIRLTGSFANYFDIYYSAHVSHIGWMGWAKNGANAGTQGYGADYPMEALRVILVKKGVTLEQAGDLEDLVDDSRPFLQK